MPLWVASHWAYRWGYKIIFWVPYLKWVYNGFNPDVGPPGSGPPPLPPGHGYELGQGTIEEPP